MSDYSPEQWKTIAQKAAAALAKNPQDHQAFLWVGKAREQLKANVPVVRAANAAANAIDNAEAGRETGLSGLQDRVIHPGLLGVSQAATAGFGDELSGDIAGSRAAIASARKDHPGAYWGGEAVGTLGTLGAPISTGRALIRPGAGAVERILARIVGSAATGGAVGGIEGAGRSEGTLQERVPTIERSAVGSAVVGGALPVIGAMTRTVSTIPRRITGDFLRNLAGKGERAVIEEAPRLDYYNPTAPPVGGQEAQLGRLAATRKFLDARAAQFPDAMPQAPQGLLGEAPVTAPAPSIKGDIQDLIASLKGNKPPVRTGPPIRPVDLLPHEKASGLLPQDFYASTADLESILRRGEVTPEYAAALRKELARRAGHGSSGTGLRGTP